MPDLTSHAATFRAGKSRTLVYAATIPQTIVHSGTLSATPTFPATSIAITTVDGDSADVRRGMTIRIETSGGVLKGILRVATSGTISSTALPINEVAAGTVNLASGDVFKVIAEWRVFDALVSNTNALNKDSRVTVGTNTSDPPPIANAGGLWAGFVDDGQTSATVSFDASVSINVDPDSSTTKTYLWDVDDGTITVGSTTTAAMTATFPVGFRHVTLTVTDSGNSKSTTRYLPVWVYDHAANRPLSVSTCQLDYTPEDGWGGRVELPKGAESGITTLPDGALLVLFAEQFYGNTRVSYGSNVSGRSHILAVGYLLRDSVSLNALNNTVSFEMVSPLGMLNRTPALPQLMVQKTSPTLWRHVKTLTTNRMLHYLSWWHDTVSNIHDFVWQITGSALNYRRVAVTDVSSIGAQLRDIAQSVNLRLTCDRLGRILFIQDYDYLSSANRANRTVVYHFTTADIRELDVTNEHRGTVKFVRGEGITDGLTANSNKPVFSNAPGKAPAPFGTGSETLARQIVDTQTDINARTGFHFAKVNGLYDGRFVPQGARLRLPPGYGWLDPAYNEPFTMTLPASSNKRGVAFTTATKWTAQTASLSFDAETGTLDPVYTIDHETTGQPGTTYVKPQQAQNGLPDFPPIDLSMPVITLPDTTPPLYRGTGTLAVFHFNSNTIHITSDFNTPSAAGGPTATPVALTLNGTIQSVIGDPFSPKYLGTGTAVNCWIATSTRLYHVADLFGSRTVTQQFVFTFAVNANQPRRVLATERAVQNFVMCATYDPSNGDGVHVAVTTDGTNWTESAITAHENTSTTDPPSPRTPSIWVSGKVAGRAYAFAYTATGSLQAATSRLFQTDDYGANWTETTYCTNAQGLGQCLHFPWHDNDNDRYFFWTKHDSSTSMQLMRSDRVLGTQTVVDPISGANKAGSSGHPYAIDSSVVNRRALVVSGARINGAVYAVGLYRSYDFGATWELVQAEATSARFLGARFAGNSQASLFLVGENGVSYTDSAGTFVDTRMATSTFVVGIIGS